MGVRDNPLHLALLSHLLRTGPAGSNKLSSKHALHSAGLTLHKPQGKLKALHSSEPRPDARLHAWQLAMDAGVSLALVLGHALVLMCQGMAFSVAMNSKRAPALIALVIASNFGEIKGGLHSQRHAGIWLVLTADLLISTLSPNPAALGHAVPLRCPAHAGGRGASVCVCWLHGRLLRLGLYLHDQPHLLTGSRQVAVVLAKSAAYAHAKH